MTQNPTEIVTIVIEDYVHRPKGLSTLFANAGLDKYWFPVSKMPKRGEDWPTVTDMVQENHRLLVFTSVAAKEEEEGVAYQWRYIVENECELIIIITLKQSLSLFHPLTFAMIVLKAGDPGVKRGSCPNRKESQPLNSKGSSLFLMNYFPTFPVEKDACKEHSAPLAEMVGTCLKSAGNRMPNFLAVNFYMVLNESSKLEYYIFCEFY